MTDGSLPMEIKYYGNYASSNLKYSVLKAHFDLVLNCGHLINNKLDGKRLYYIEIV